MTNKRGATALIERAARDLSIALIVGVGIGLTLTYVGVGEALHLVPSSPTQDWHVYFDAAERVRSGALLYPPQAAEDFATTYRYSSWFAIAWVPLTYLPRDVVGVGWVTAMFVASGIALWPFTRSREPGILLLGGLLAPFLAEASIHGNVQPAIVAALVHTIDRRAGPVAVGLAASLKGFPLLYAVRYAVLGEWRNCFVAVAVAAIFASPMLLFDLTYYPLRAGPFAGLWLISPVAWAIGAVLGVAALVRFARGPGSWFAASLALVLVEPRLLFYDLTYMLVIGRRLLRGERVSGPARGAPAAATQSPPR